jgi:phenylalanyl-tRNA synthetase beta chain
MEFSRDWLAQYVKLPTSDPSASGQATAEWTRQLTNAGLAVEGVREAGSDVVVDVDVTTNRPDCMNHLGLARELAVIRGVELKRPDTDSPESGAPAEEVVSIHLEAGPECPRYVGRVLREVEVRESPDWLKDSLQAIGLRPINNVVDVTNYVLWETGQPLHAFDLDEIAGSEIRVRRARAGETLTTLDGEERKLDPEDLVIADAERPVALAGVMGGLDSEVTEATRTVLLESAHFDRARVRKTARRLGMKTDASHRFERGADPEMCRFAADRAFHLLSRMDAGKPAPGAVDAREDLPRAPAGRLDLKKLHDFAGVEIPGEEVERILTGLGFRLEADGHGSWRVQVPSWRIYDFDPRPEPPHETYPADL